jgi:acetolactate synthase I/II/III large subunit
LSGSKTPVNDWGGEWQSDVIAELIKRYEFPYIALNPGASYRGLHDSLVNHNHDQPPMLLCQHEKIAVQIAHGYAKATGKPMVAIVHNVVGMLHALMGVYYAYIDRAPIFIIGATGPMDEGKRRPFIDWIHTANVQGDQLRNYVKWDYQPGGIDGVPDSFARAYAIMMSEPQGPTYMCYDAWLQEAPITEPVAFPLPDSARVPSPIAASATDLERVADRLLRAEWPVLLAEYVGRSANGFDALVTLAETVGAPVVDVNARLNFPSCHPLNLSLSPAAFENADLIVGLDLRDWQKPTHKMDWIDRTAQPIYPLTCRWVEIGFGDVEISKWSTDYQRFPDAVERIIADTALAIPALADICRRRLQNDPEMARRVAQRAAAVGRRHAALRSGWRADADKNRDAVPMTEPRLALEIWNAIKDEDWVLSASTLNEWARKLWDFDRSYRHPGRALGTGTQIGISLGVALAHKGTGRVVVDIQPDGDLLFDTGALWTAARYQLPMLTIMFNNRAYYNDWNHQIEVAEHRGRPLERAHIGQDIIEPPPDFATIARGFGWHAEGPIERPDELGPAMVRAIAVVKAGKPALIDAIVRRKHERVESQ